MTQRTEHDLSKPFRAAESAEETLATQAPSSAGTDAGNAGKARLMTPAEQRRYERKRRQRELLIAAGAFLLVLILTTLQLDHFRSGSGTIFVVLFNINFILLAGILLVVLRNAVKLLLERRRRVMGSRLRTKLVLAFVGFALLPCLLMLFVTTRYVQLSMDFWFKVQVETSMETALDVTRNAYESTGRDLLFVADAVQKEVTAGEYLWAGKDMDALLERKRLDYRLALVGLYVPGKDATAKTLWHAQEESNIAFDNALKEMPAGALESQGVLNVVADGPAGDYLISFSRSGRADGTFFVLAKDLGPEFKQNLELISRGAGEYKNLRNIKRPLKIMLYSSLGVLSILILLGAVWFGFRLARELSSPILALAAGTQRIAKGDLSVRLDDFAEDELGMLIRSFNRMAEDLETNRKEIVGANAMLEEQNLRIAAHSSYIETVLNNIAAGVLSFDEQGVINTANRAACEILDKTADQLVGKRIEDILPAPATQEARRTGSRHTPDAPTRHHVTLTAGGEERRLLFTVVDFSTDGVQRGSVAVFEDVSELERMQRMAAWREVARRIAHEIKNPLTPIKLSAQRLSRKFGEQVNDPAFTQSTQLIVRQVEYLQSMVQEFSAFAKLPEVRPKPDRLEPLLEGITDLFRNSHSGIRWALDIPAPLPEMLIDKESLHRAFMNIYTNAAEALQHAGVSQPEVTITAVYRPSLRMVRVNVADNGPGLAEEDLPRLFEPYFSRKKGGTGLGLSIVRSIVTDHHGYIRVHPREEGGTVLAMELPLQ